MKQIIKIFLEKHKTIKDGLVEIYFEGSELEITIMEFLFMDNMRVDRGVSGNGFRYVDIIIRCTEEEYQEALKRIEEL